MTSAEDPASCVRLSIGACRHTTGTAACIPACPISPVLRSSPMTVTCSVFILANISVTSPLKLATLIIKKGMFVGSKYPKNVVLIFENKITGPLRAVGEYFLADVRKRVNVSRMNGKTTRYPLY